MITLAIKEEKSEKPPKHINIENSPFKIGRAPDNHLVLNRPNIAPSHCMLISDNNGLSIRDMGSEAGTFLNGVRIKQDAKLTSDSIVRIGDFQLRFVKEPIHANAQRADTQQKTISKDTAKKIKESLVVIKRKVHDRLLQELDLKHSDLFQSTDKDIKRNAEKAVQNIVDSLSKDIPPYIRKELVIKEVTEEALGLGPIEDLLKDSEIDEIMINGSSKIYVERHGKLELTDKQFTDDSYLLNVIRRIISPIGRRIDESSPMVDARLADGSRVNAIIPPLSLCGPALTIRKFSQEPFTIDDLVAFGSMTKEIGEFLRGCVEVRKNIIISGGTGSGKTTLLNVVSGFIPHEERIVTIEDAAELKLSHENLVSLESKPANIEGEGAVPIRKLVINSLRMRPDRIIVGECRGGEALDMLQAMNTGHDGSLTTLHANSPRDALSRLETMVLMAGMELPSKAIREQIQSAVNIIVQISRMKDGSRRIVKISEITGMQGDVITMQDIFVFTQTGVEQDGKVIGKLEATGMVPSFFREFESRGINIDIGIFKKE